MSVSSLRGRMVADVNRHPLRSSLRSLASNRSTYSTHSHTTAPFANTSGTLMRNAARVSAAHLRRWDSDYLDGGDGDRFFKGQKPKAHYRSSSASIEFRPHCRAEVGGVREGKNNDAKVTVHTDAKNNDKSRNLNPNATENENKSTHKVTKTRTEVRKLKSDVDTLDSLQIPPQDSQKTKESESDKFDLKTKISEMQDEIKALNGQVHHYMRGFNDQKERADGIFSSLKRQTFHSYGLEKRVGDLQMETEEARELGRQSSHLWWKEWEQRVQKQIDEKKNRQKGHALDETHNEIIWEKSLRGEQKISSREFELNNRKKEISDLQKEKIDLKTERSDLRKERHDLKQENEDQAELIAHLTEKMETQKNAYAHWQGVVADWQKEMTRKLQESANRESRLSGELDAFKQRTLIFYNVVEQHRAREKTKRSRLSRCDCLAFDVVPAGVPRSFPHSPSAAPGEVHPKSATKSSSAKATDTVVKFFRISSPAVIDDPAPHVNEEAEPQDPQSSEIDSEYSTTDPTDPTEYPAASNSNPNVFKWDPPPVTSTVTTNCPDDLNCSESLNLSADLDAAWGNESEGSSAVNEKVNIKVTRVMVSQDTGNQVSEERDYISSDCRE